MNKEETTKVLAILKAAYPNNYKGMTETDARATVNVWQTEFAEIPVDVVLIAVYKAISVSEFPPTVAAIRKTFRSIYIESDILFNELKSSTPDAEKYSNMEKYLRIKEILQPYFIARNCPEIALHEIMNNLSLKNGGAQIGANAGEIEALPKGKGGNK